MPTRVPILNALAPTTFRWGLTKAGSNIGITPRSNKATSRSLGTSRVVVVDACEDAVLVVAGEAIVATRASVFGVLLEECEGSQGFEIYQSS